MHDEPKRNKRFLEFSLRNSWDGNVPPELTTYIVNTDRQVYPFHRCCSKIVRLDRVIVISILPDEISLYGK